MLSRRYAVGGVVCSAGGMLSEVWSDQDKCDYMCGLTRTAVITSKYAFAFVTFTFQRVNTKVCMEKYV